MELALDHRRHADSTRRLPAASDTRQPDKRGLISVSPRNPATEVEAPSTRCIITSWVLTDDGNKTS